MSTFMFASMTLVSVLDATLDVFVPLLGPAVLAILVFNVLVVATLVHSRTATARTHRKAINAGTADWGAARWYMAHRMDREGNDYSDTLYLLHGARRDQLNPAFVIDWVATGRTFKELANLCDAGFSSDEMLTYVHNGESLDSATLQVMGSLLGVVL